MRIDSIVANLRALLRAHSIIYEIKARHFVARSGVTGFAVVIGAFGVVMLGLAAFFALEQLWGPIWAAVAIGISACAVALILIFIAGHLKAGRDLELAHEVRRSAVEGLLNDGRSIEAELTDLKIAFNHPVDSLIPSIIVPLAGILLKAVQRKTEKSDTSPGN